MGGEEEGNASKTMPCVFVYLLPLPCHLFVESVSKARTREGEKQAGRQAGGQTGECICMTVCVFVRERERQDNGKE